MCLGTDVERGHVGKGDGDKEDMEERGLSPWRPGRDTWSWDDSPLKLGGRGLGSAREVISVQSGDRNHTTDLHAESL